MSFNPFANKADLEAAQSQIASLTEDLSTAQVELTAERETVATQAQSISDLQAQVATLTAERETVATQAQEQIETLQASVRTAEQKAIELLAQNGHEAPIEIIETSGTNYKTRAEFNAMNHIERNEFLSNGGKLKG